tara:strand:- start:363 stop:1196 length:834 start_codon:yes stop_codon:yes gene_type:complete
MNAIDIISLASYDNYHYNQLKLAIQNGKHVFVEKPMCLNNSELKKIYKLKSKYSKNIISSNMVLRANPRFVYIKKLFDQKKLGKLIYSEADYFWGRFHKLSQWRSKIKNYSLLLGASVHLIDLIIWILNQRPVKVIAFGNRIGATKAMINSSTFSSIKLIFKDDLIINVNAHGLSIHPHYHSLKFFTTTKTIIHQFSDSYMINKHNLNKKITLKQPYPFRENRHKIIDSFVNKIVSKKEDNFFVSFNNMLDTMNICLAAIKSEKTGKKITIKYNHFQ